MGFITREGYKGLDNYRYKAGQYTILDNIMNYYWEWCVKLIPMWVAPNLLTFVGWLLVIASYANMLRYDYTFTKELPSSAFYFASVCIFAYSTLDAIDGKQARRTKSSSPLGQLFDHGCDSFSLAFFILAICQATRIQKDEVFLIFISTQLAFWTSNWSEHHTGILRTKVGQFGVTEGEYTLVLVHFLTGLFGQNMWKVTALDILPSSLAYLKDDYPFLNYIYTEQLGTLVIHGFAVSIMINIAYIVITTLYSGNERVAAICQFFSVGLIAIMQIIWSNLSIYQKYNGIILTNFGVIASLLICKMIICSVTKMHFQYFHYQLVPTIVFTLIMLSLDKMRTSSDVMANVFWISFLVNIGMILTFLYSTINEITAYLGIQCFTLKKVPRKMQRLQ